MLFFSYFFIGGFFCVLILTSPPSHKKKTVNQQKKATEPLTLLLPKIKFKNLQIAAKIMNENHTEIFLVNFSNLCGKF
jgi:hypothetical protein